MDNEYYEIYKGEYNFESDKFEPHSRNVKSLRRLYNDVSEWQSNGVITFNKKNKSLYINSLKLSNTDSVYHHIELGEDLYCVSESILNKSNIILRDKILDLKSCLPKCLYDEISLYIRTKGKKGSHMIDNLKKIEFYKNGNIKNQKNYNTNETSWHPNGTISDLSENESNYVRISWYDNGQKSSESTIDNNEERTQTVSSWYENGVPSLESIKKYNFEVSCKRWYPSGNKMEFKDAYNEIKSTTYYDNCSDDANLKTIHINNKEIFIEFYEGGTIKKYTDKRNSKDWDSEGNLY